MAAYGNNGGAQGEGPADIFFHAAPEGHAKTTAAVLGEIVWLMSQSRLHKQFFIHDLEWPVAHATRPKDPMTPVLMQQFRLFYDQQKPIGVVLWARVSAEVEAMLSVGTTRLRPQDWRSGDRLWVVEVNAPFGGAEEMVRDLKAKVFPERELKYVAVGASGKPEVRGV